MSTNTDDSLGTTEEQEEYKLKLRFGKYGVRRIDAFNIIVEEFKVTKDGKNVGQEYSITIGYYKRIHEALKRVLSLGIEQKSIKSLTEVMTALKDAEELLYKELDSKYKDIKKD